MKNFKGEIILNTIDALHRTKVGKVSDKWASYLTYYDALFASRQYDDISMLEIGIQNGGSLETWANYFKSAKIFVGCDIDPKCALLNYDDPRISVVVGNANASPAFNEIHGLSKGFDIIIDDGSHQSVDIINSFINYFPSLNPGGIYVVEDSHCLYDDGYGGGILNEYSAYAFFKKLIDMTNFQFWKDHVSASTYFTSFFPAAKLPAFISDGWVDALEFRNSIITIHKAKLAGHNKLGERVVVGSIAQVQSWGGQFGTFSVSR